MKQGSSRSKSPQSRNLLRTASGTETHFVSTIGQKPPNAKICSCDGRTGRTETQQIEKTTRFDFCPDEGLSACSCSRIFCALITPFPLESKCSKFALTRTVLFFSVGTATSKHCGAKVKIGLIIYAVWNMWACDLHKYFQTSLVCPVTSKQHNGFLSILCEKRFTRLSCSKQGLRVSPPHSELFLLYYLRTIFSIYIEKHCSQV